MGREVSQQTDLLGRYAGGDNKDAAVRVLFDLIVRRAKEMDFAGAKALREKWSYAVTKTTWGMIS